MNYYRSTVRELQRLTSTNASPIYAHFGETLDGVSTVRAYLQDEYMLEQNREMLGSYLRPLYIQQVSSQWLGMRLQFMGSIIVGCTAAIAVFEFGGKHMDPAKAGMVGFALSHSLNVVDTLSGFIYAFVSAETNLVAMERLDAYDKLPQEADLTLPEDEALHAEWPRHGEVEFEDVWMSYREGLDPVLRGLSFRVRAGHKVGIVGRTGAGKSSVLVALFRLADPLSSGRILIDGLDVQNVGLGTLRGAMSIIPQDPVLISGTLRSNLDPANEHSEAEVWDAVRSVALDSFVDQRNGKLDMTIEPNGENLSVGQRQLFCLARALLRKAKIVVLDEATASVDQATDEFIQRTLRKLEGVTMLTIAHRLDTIIDYDMVCVLSKGEVLEYAPPKELVALEGSVFGDMWQKFQGSH